MKRGRSGRPISSTCRCRSTTAWWTARLEPLSVTPFAGGYKTRQFCCCRKSSKLSWRFLRSHCLDLGPGPFRVVARQRRVGRLGIVDRQVVTPLAVRLIQDGLQIEAHVFVLLPQG